MRRVGEGFLSMVVHHRPLLHSVKLTFSPLNMVVSKVQAVSFREGNPSISGGFVFGQDRRVFL